MTLGAPHKALAGAACLAAVAGLPGHAQDQPLPDFSSCMDLEMARFERALGRLQALPEPADFEIGDVRGVEFCGTLGIVKCDRSEAPLPCQRALAKSQDALLTTILQALPEPKEPSMDDPEHSALWTDQLYPQLYALAHDSSAGPDCAGNTATMQAWCEAREANRRVMSAVLTWQLARYLGEVPDAVTAGWAQVPPPTRPQARPQEDTQ